MKSCKQVGKNLSDMSKELEILGQNSSVGDLPEKMEQADTAKTEVETQLLERVSWIDFNIIYYSINFK